ncbi:hypothetical protein [Gilvimarinus algae]|uniref:Uncharacterized protein n=1 Tax=Gilvimarinus algae TaxID=3058037 RepID=A0ABT8THI3_9GAMM|nr:hypothetical protein [Gilvimarinus sp. SDUM040014]MDO3381762.1 hypothetical protein [Gilvimarinus sp. SDUM040014]
MNSKLIFSQAGVFRLQQLASLIYRHTGVRHKLSSQRGQLDLLLDGTRSPHADVRNCCAHLADELHPHQLSALRSEGVVLTPSTLVTEKAG